MIKVSFLKLYIMGLDLVATVQESILMLTDFSCSLFRGQP